MCLVFQLLFYVISEYDYLDDHEVSHCMGKVGQNLVKMHIDYQILKRENSTHDESTDTEADRLRREQIMARFMVKEEVENEAFDDEIPMEVIDKMRKLRHINNELSDSDDDDEDNDYFNSEDSDESPEKLNELAQKWTLLKKKREEMEKRIREDEERQKKQQEKSPKIEKSRVESLKQSSSKSSLTALSGGLKTSKSQDKNKAKDRDTKKSKNSKTANVSSKNKSVEPKLSTILPKVDSKDLRLAKSSLKTDQTNSKTTFKTVKKELICHSSLKQESSTTQLSQKFSKSPNFNQRKNVSSSESKNRNEKFFSEKSKLQSSKLPAVSSSFYVKHLKTSHENEKDRNGENLSKSSTSFKKDIKEKEKSHKSEKYDQNKHSFEKTDKNYFIASGSTLQNDQKKNYSSSVYKQPKTDKRNDIKDKYENKSSRSGYTDDNRNNNSKRRLEKDDNRIDIKKSRF